MHLSISPQAWGTGGLCRLYVFGTDPGTGHLAGKGWPRDPFLQTANENHAPQFFLPHSSPLSKQIHSREGGGTKPRVTKSVAKILWRWHNLLSRPVPQPTDAFYGVEGSMKRIIITSFSLWQSSVNIKFGMEGSFSGDN